MKRREKPRNKKPRFAHDENLEFKLLYKESNRFALFKSFIKIAGKRAILDPEVISICNKNDYHIITHNTNDFQHPVPKIKVGIVCIGSRIDKNWVKLFNKFLNKYPRHEDIYYKNVLISNRITIKDRKTGKNTIL